MSIIRSVSKLNQTVKQRTTDDAGNTRFNVVRGPYKADVSVNSKGEIDSFGIESNRFSFFSPNTFFNSNVVGKQLSEVNEENIGDLV